MGIRRPEISKSWPRQTRGLRNESKDPPKREQDEREQDEGKEHYNHPRNSLPRGKITKMANNAVTRRGKPNQRGSEHPKRPVRGLLTPPRKGKERKLLLGSLDETRKMIGGLFQDCTRYVDNM